MAAADDHELVAETIARVPLFRGLSKDHREDIARHTTRRSYPAGSTIVKQGDTSMSLLHGALGESPLRPRGREPAPRCDARRRRAPARSSARWA